MNGSSTGMRSHVNSPSCCGESGNINNRAQATNAARMTKSKRENALGLCTDSELMGGDYGFAEAATDSGTTLGLIGCKCVVLGSYTNALLPKALQFTNIKGYQRISIKIITGFILTTSGSQLALLALIKRVAALSL